MEHSESGAAFTRLLLEVFRFNGVLLAEGDRMTRDLGLSSARWQVMGAIDRGPRTVARIAREMGLARQSVQRSVDRLAADGLVVLEDNPHHKRAKLVRLSDEGRDRLDRVSALQKAWANDISEEVAAEDLAAARILLARLRRRLEGER